MKFRFHESRDIHIETPDASTTEGGATCGALNEGASAAARSGGKNDTAD